MASIPVYDPGTEEAKSPFIAGITEGLNKISEILNLKIETATDVQLRNVPISDTDKNRIYQAPDGKRLWIPTPEPIIKKNGSVITQESDGFEIDYVGGSVSFPDNSILYDDDSLTASFTYIVAGSIKINNMVQDINEATTKAERYKGSYQTYELLIQNVPLAVNGDFAFVIDNFEIYVWDNSWKIISKKIDAIEVPETYSGNITVSTKSTDKIYVNFEGQTTITGNPSPSNPATITGVPFSATATSADGQSRSIDLGVGYSLADGAVKDTFDGKNGDFVQRVGKLVMDGTEDIGYAGPIGNNQIKFYYNYEFPLKNPEKSFSTHAIYNDQGTQEGLSTFYFYTSFKGINFIFDKSVFTNLSLDGVKAWLAAQFAAGTPVTVYYELAEPIVYNRNADIQAFYGTTTVTGAKSCGVIDDRVLRFDGKLPFEVVHSNPNILDNWYFADLINQMGKNEYQSPNNASYTIDRWLINRGKINVDSNGIIVTNLDSENSCAFSQRIEPDRLLLNALYTFSFIADSNLYSVTFNINTMQQKTINDNFGIRWTIKKDYVQIILDIMTSAKLIAAKLELGIAQTLARKIDDVWVLNDPPPDKTLELLKCQRYQFNFLDTSNTNQSYLVKVKASSSKVAYGTTPIPTVMRNGIPTLVSDCSNTMPYTSFGIFSDGYATKENIIGISLHQKMNNAVILKVTGSNFIPGNDYQVFMENSNMHTSLLDMNL